VRPNAVLGLDIVDSGERLQSRSIEKENTGFRSWSQRRGPMKWRSWVGTAEREIKRL